MDSSVVIGIDPGINTTGYSIVRVANGSVYLEDLGFIKVPKGVDFSQRLFYLYESALDLFVKYHESLVVFEDIYSNLKYPYTAVLMGHARAVLFIAACMSKCEIKTISPAQVKKAITGRGNASKEQVRGVLGQIYQLSDKLENYPLDVSDSLAVATGYIFLNVSAFRE